MGFFPPQDAAYVTLHSMYYDILTDYGNTKEKQWLVSTHFFVKVLFKITSSHFLVLKFLKSLLKTIPSFP